ncbi:hypothetical protein [Pseudomonas aeruginosa]
MTTLDTAALKVLTDIFVDIVGTRIPDIFRQEDAGSQATQRVIGLWQKALHCAERAAELSAAHPPTQRAFLRRAAKVREYVEEAQFELQAWLEAEAISESKGQTLH